MLLDQRFALDLPNLRDQLKEAISRGLVPANTYEWSGVDFLVIADLLAENGYEQAETYFRLRGQDLVRREEEEAKVLREEGFTDLDKSPRAVTAHMIPEAYMEAVLNRSGEEQEGRVVSGGGKTTVD
jgi:hypothetical protein